MAAALRRIFAPTFEVRVGLNEVRTQISRYKVENANLGALESASFSLYKLCRFVYNENMDIPEPVSVCDVL